MISGRSSGRPKRSSVAARKQAPPSMPPTKKYRMMSQVQCGGPVKKVSDIAGSSAPPHDRVDAVLPNSEQREETQDHGGRAREQRASPESAAGEPRVGRQPVGLRLVHQEVERVEAAQGVVGIGAVQVRLRFPLGVQLVYPPMRPLPQLAHRAELDQTGRAALRAG